MNKMKKVLALLLCLVMTVSVFAGCSSSGSSAEATTAGTNSGTASETTQTEDGKTYKRIVIANSDNVVALDPAAAEDSVSCVIVGNTIEGLFSVTPDGVVEPAMASNVEVSDDSLTWTFTIRDDAYWTNGDPVTADDFVFGIQRISDPNASVSPFAYEVESAHIKNATPVVTGEMPLDQLGVTAKDDKTLVIELDTPCSYLEALLSFSAFAPTNRAFYESKGEEFALTPEDTLFNGPYVVSSFDTGSNVVTLTKNPTYYDAANVDIDEITFQTIGDTQSAVMAFENGDVDVITLTGDTVEQKKDDPAFQSGLGMFNWYLSFNTLEVPNANLRKAISCAIDVVNWQFLTTVTSVLKGTVGIAGNLLNTLLIVLLTMLIATPLGVGAAVYLNEYARPGKLVSAIEFATETLSGIPSIIFGLFGSMFFGETLGLGYSLLTGSLTLILMVLPLITRNTQEALKTVPDSYRSGALGLGAGKWYMIRTVLLPSATPGILTGAILAVGRIVGESAALLFTAGSAKALPKTFGKLLEKIFHSGGTLTIQLYLSATADGDFTTAFGIAVVLLVLVLCINLTAKKLASRLDPTRRK